MKTKKLPIEGEEKLKLELVFDFDEVKITLLEGGRPTKYTDTLTFTNVNFNDPSDFEKNYIAETLLKIYHSYLRGKKTEEYLAEIFENGETASITYAPETGEYS